MKGPVKRQALFCARTALSQPLNSQYGKQVDQ